MFKRNLIIIIVLALCAGAVGWYWSNQRAEDPKANLQAVQRLKALAIDFTFSDKLIVGRSETDAELAVIQERCKKLETIARSAQQLSFKSAVTDTKELSATAKTLELSCKNYIEQIALAKDTSKFDEQKQALLTSSGSSTCTGGKACLDPANYAQYKQYFQEDIAFAKGATNYFRRSCPFLEYTKVCELNLAYFKKNVALNEAYNNALDGSDVTPAAQAYDSNIFPKEAVCTEVRILTKDDTVKSECFTVGFQYLAAQYEAKLAAEFEKI